MRFLIGLLILFILVVGIIAFKNSDYYEPFVNNLSKHKGTIVDNIGILIDNILTDINPARKRPVSFLNKEAKLKDYLPEVFEKFTKEEWDRFWDLIYGLKDEGKGLIKKKVYRNQSEVEDYLGYNYPNPFSYFQRQHWDYFWSIIFDKR